MSGRPTGLVCLYKGETQIPKGESKPTQSPKPKSKDEQL